MILESGRRAGVDLPLERFDGGPWGGAPFACILDMRREGHLCHLMIAPALGNRLQGGLGFGLRRKPLGLEMEELLLHLLRLFRLRVGERMCRPLPGVLRRDDQPPLRHAIMTQLHPLVPDGLLQGLPLPPGPGRAMSCWVIFKVLGIG